MGNKEYSGLKAELIMFDGSEISTDAVAFASTCTVSSVQFYTSDYDGKPMQFGTCWYATPDDVSLTWSGYGGRFE